MNKTSTHFLLPSLLLWRKITRPGRNKICSKTPCWKLTWVIPFRHSWWLLESFWGSFSAFDILLWRKITRPGRNKICSKTPCWKLTWVIPFRHSWWLLESFWGSFSAFDITKVRGHAFFYAILFLVRAMIGSEFEWYRLKRHSVWSRWKEP